MMRPPLLIRDLRLGPPRHLFASVKKGRVAHVSGEKAQIPRPPRKVTRHLDKSLAPQTCQQRDIVEIELAAKKQPHELGVPTRDRLPQEVRDLEQPVEVTDVLRKGTAPLD